MAVGALRHGSGKAVAGKDSRTDDVKGKGSIKGKDKPAGKGKNSGGKGKETGGSGKGRGSTKNAAGGGGNAAEASNDVSLSGARTVQEVEAAIFTAKLAVKTSSAVGKQPLEAKGEHCEVKKHSEMGCAVVTMESEIAREAIIKYYVFPRTVTSDDGKQGRAQIQIGDHTAQVRPHVDKDSKAEIKTDLFLAWGHKSEKLSPLSADSIAQAFDQLYLEVATTSAHQQQQQMQQHQMLLMQQLQQHQQQHQHTPVQQGCHTPPSQAVGGNAQLEMRADAPSFMFAPTPDAYAAYAEFDMYGHAAYPPVPERKPLTIVNPKSGQPIEVAPTRVQAETLPSQVAGRKKMAIIDPASGSAVDALGINFSPPKQAKPLSIIDPTSGACIKV